jgi:subtilisin
MSEQGLPTRLQETEFDEGLSWGEPLFEVPPRRHSLYASLAGQKAQASMSPNLASELEQRGVAQALVILSQEAAAVPAAGLALADSPIADLYSHFIKDPHSPSAALMTAAAALETAMPSAVTFDQAPAVRHFPRLGILLGDVRADGAVALANDQRVRYVASSVSLRLIRPPQPTAAAKLTQTLTWGLQKLQVDALWNARLTGAGVRVGHLDTGVDGDHPALQGAIAGFMLTDANGFEVSGAPVHDSGTHGTHTAGTIAGRPVNGRHIGVAPQAQLYSAAVIEGGNVVERIIAGMEWALANDVKIISMSLGLPGYQDDFLEVIRRLRSLNVLPVVAVGNEGPGTSRYPGNYEEVLSVGACDEGLRVANFSSSDAFAARVRDKVVPDLVGPGVGVISCVPGGGYHLSDGTSMATPHIAGLAALLWQAKPAASAREIERAILKSCKLEPQMRFERANRGFPSAIRAYEQLTGQSLPQAATRVMIVRAAKAGRGRRAKRKSRKAVKKAPRAKRGNKR